ncbi:MAG: glycosyltransferase, partial [Bacteroidia bacterium]|nr:glycosyltransferase [Bacteroidia bacterium]
MPRKILYISYDGMTDPLGQSQVIPYIIGLSKKGYSFHLISCEKPVNFSSQEYYIRNLLEENNIVWHPLPYTKSPPVLSTLLDIFRIKRKAIRLHRKENFSLIHCRSYIAALIGLAMKKKYGTKFIFDMRGLWADERVEGGLWNLKNPLYKFVYNYFKKKERQFLSKADYTISLTHSGKEEMHSWKTISNQPVPVEVIPCCVDTSLFSPDNISNESVERFRSEMKLSKSHFVISYLGATGTWYLLDEMMLFFKHLLKTKPEAKFLFITPENPETILNSAKSKSVSAEKIIIRKAARNDVPALMSLSNVSVFFYRSAYCNIARSPTKLAEALALGIPVICNSNVGDTDSLVLSTQTGIVVNNFSEDSFEKAVG